MLKLIRIFIVVSFMASCSEQEDIVLEAEGQNLNARVSLNPSISDLRNNEVKVSGHLMIQNLTVHPQLYSNGWLWLRTEGGLSARAWLGNLTSHHIDESTVEVPANGTLDIPVYWVFPESARDQLTSQSLALELKRDD